MRCVCGHFARSNRSYLDSLCTVIGRGGEQLHSFLAFLLHAAGEGFGEGVDPQIGGAIAWGGKAVSRGQVLFVRSSTTSSSRRQCDGGGGSGLFSDSDSFYQLCQLSALPASILGLSEQTKTGATRGRGRQGRRKPMPQAVLARRPIQYTSRLVFAFF